MSPPPIRSRESRAGGRVWSGRESRLIRIVIVSSAPMLWAAAWGRPARTPWPRMGSLMPCAFPSSPFATWCARRRCCSTIWELIGFMLWSVGRWGGCRFSLGRRPIPPGSMPPWSLPQPPDIRRRISPFMKSADRRSWPIPIGGAGIIMRMDKPPIRVWPSPAWPRTSLICRNMA